MFMNGSFVADAVYNLILYLMLAMTALPVIYFCLWSFRGFFKKRRILFYLLCLFLFGSVIGGFYFTKNDWLLWYYAFPSYVQIIGLLLISSSFILMRLTDHQLGVKVRFFWHVLSDKRFQLSTNGVFKYVRHPIYALIPLMIAGALMYTGEFMLLCPLIFNLMTRWWYARKEEAYVRQFADGDYSAYMKQTPNRFYPKVI